MIRLKFLIFAFLAVGLGLAHLFLLSGPMEAQALREAQVQAGSGTAEVMRTLEARRGIARALALKLAGSPELVSSAQQMTEPEAPAAERFAAVRAAAEALLPKEQQGVVLGVVTEAGAWHVRSGGEPSSDAAVLDVKALTQGETPLVVEAFGAPHTFAAVPLVWKFVRIPGAERLEVRLDATLVVGVPLLPEGVLDSAATASGVSALAVVKEQTVVASGGAQKALVDSLKEQLKAGEPAKAVKRGQLQALGPVKLPMLTTGKDFLGGQAVLEVGTRRAVEGTSYEVIAIASPKLMGTLAAYQRGGRHGDGVEGAAQIVAHDADELLAQLRGLVGAQQLGIAPVQLILLLELVAHQVREVTEHLQLVLGERLRIGIQRAHHAKGGPVAPAQGHGDVALDAVRLWRGVVREPGILAGVVDEQRRGGLVHHAAEGGGDVRHVASAQAEVDLVHDGTAAPGIVGDSGDQGDAHARGLHEDPENRAHCIDTADCCYLLLKALTGSARGLVGGLRQKWHEGRTIKRAA